MKKPCGAAAVPRTIRHFSFSLLQITIGQPARQSSCTSALVLRKQTSCGPSSLTPTILRDGFSSEGEIQHVSYVPRLLNNATYGRHLPKISPRQLASASAMRIRKRHCLLADSERYVAQTRTVAFSPPPSCPSCLSNRITWSSRHTPLCLTH